MNRNGGTAVLLLCLAACEPAANTQTTTGKQSGPPPPALLYQTRAEELTGDRLIAGRNGEGLFSNKCGYCHLTGGMGTNLLTKQRLAMREPAETGLLANRKDLTADYVKSVVRLGKGAMPSQTKVDITDAELESVAKYLGKASQ
jgi:mono/diheme cytochrome c family protein